jgi:hypothetical protein
MISSQDNADPDVANNGVVTSYFDQNLDTDFEVSELEDNWDQFFFWTSNTDQAFSIVTLEYDENAVDAKLEYVVPPIARVGDAEPRASINITYRCLQSSVDATISVSVNVSKWDPITFSYIKECTRPEWSGFAIFVFVYVHVHCDVRCDMICAKPFLCVCCILTVVCLFRYILSFHQCVLYHSWWLCTGLLV